MERVNNTVRLKVWKGFIVVGRKGPNRLPPPHLQEISVHDQRDAQGLVKLSTLRLLPGAPRAPRPRQVAERESARPGGGAGAVPYGFLDQTKVKSDAVRPRSATVTTPPRWANSCALPSVVT